MKNHIVFSLVVILVLVSACAGAPGTQVPATATTTEQPLNMAGPGMKEAAAPRTITVTGASQVAITPDIAFITVGSHQEADTVVEAVANSNQGVQNIIQALKDAGIEDKDLQTSNFSVYTTDKYGPDGLRTGSTYVVENTIYITVRNLDNLGDILNEAVNAGANSIWGIQFDKSDKSKELSQGRAEAVKLAEAQAKELAKAAGVTLGEVQSITHYSGYSMPYGQGMGGGGGGAGYAMNSSIAISPGQMYLQVEVTVAYLVE
jgi:uncharacterized protein YggE